MANETQKDMKQAPPVFVTGKAEETRFRRTRMLGRATARILLVLLFCAGIYLSLFPAGRADLRTTLLLPTLLGASEPAELMVADESVRHTQMIVPAPAGGVYLDVYQPTTPIPPIPGVRGGVVMIPGVGDNRAVPQLVNLATAFAHTGLVVMTMTTPTLIDNTMSAQDSDGVVQAFETLAHWPGVNAHRIGLVGFSGGGPLVCFAAADPRIRDQVAFVALFGSYYNATSLLHAFGQRGFMVNGHLQHWQPDPYPKQVLADTIAGTLPSLESTLLQNAFAPGGKPLTAADLAQMSPPAVAAYHLLIGDEPGQVDANIAALSLQMHALLDQLSINRVIDKIRAPVYLLHDRSDPSIPFTESRECAATLARIHHPYDLAEFGIFSHVQVKSDLGIGQLLSDGPHLFHVLSQIVYVGS
jgi:acetyl esterase/lipase